MARMLYCIFLMVPLVGLPVVGFRVSTTGGIIGAVIAAVLAVPLTLSALAHFDLFREKSRYEFSEDELHEFIRLVPQLVGDPNCADLPSAERKRAAKRAAAERIIRQRHDNRRSTAGA